MGESLGGRQSLSGSWSDPELSLSLSFPRLHFYEG